MTVAGPIGGTRFGLASQSYLLVIGGHLERRAAEDNA
jgi:hypothetical protein